MYNVKIIEYPQGYQVKLYDTYLGREDDNRHEIIKNDNVQELERDCWHSCQSSFEEIFEIEEWKSEESKRISFSRTKKNIYYIARSNVWEWFCTFTVSPEKVDRYDYKECKKKITKWLNHQKERYAPDLYYLVVPEQHKDGAWHFHGLLGGCAGLVFSDSGHFTSDNQPIYNIDSYKLGFSTATAVKDTNKVSGYICKYITKDLCGVLDGRNRYFVSKGIGRAPEYEMLVPWYQFEDLKKGLYENMTWKKKENNGFYDIDYFEVRKEWGEMFKKEGE